MNTFVIIYTLTLSNDIINIRIFGVQPSVYSDLSLTSFKFTIIIPQGEKILLARETVKHTGVKTLTRLRKDSTTLCERIQRERTT